MPRHRNFLKRHHARVYRRTQRFRNPYFAHAPKRFWWWKRALAGLAALGIVIGVLYGLASLPWFHITIVAAEGLTTIPESRVEGVAWEQIHKRRWLVFPQQSWIFLNDRALEERLLQHFTLSTLTISRDGHTLTIDARERLTSLVWRSADHWALLDLDGAALRDLEEAEKTFLSNRVETGAGELAMVTIDPNIPVIVDQSGAEFEKGDSLLSAASTQGVIALDGQIRSLLLIPILFEIESRDLNWMRVKTPQVDLLVNAEGDIDEQVRAIDIILDEYDPGTLEYIDVRFGNNVYVKEKS